jgi:hypothetical protein
MKESEKKSEACNERDRKGYRKTFDSLIQRFGNFFKPPILSEQEAEKDVDTLKLVEDLLPELTIENVEKLGHIL